MLEIVSSNNGGREFEIRTVANGQTILGTVPRELLDDELGDDSTPSEREAWVVANAERISATLVTKLNGGVTTAPFSRVVIRGGE